jgi:hypothetical protein
MNAMTTTQEIRLEQAMRPDLDQAQVQAGVWTASLAALVALAATQALPLAVGFAVIAAAIHKRQAWAAIAGGVLALGLAVAVAAGLVPVALAARVPLALLAAAGGLCFAGAWMTLTGRS